MKEMFDGNSVPEQIVGHKINDVVSFGMTADGYAIIPEESVVNQFPFSPGLDATMVMKTRPYSDKDGMLVVQQTNGEHIESIEGLYSSELLKLLQLAEKASEIGLNGEDFQFISINSHNSGSYGYAETKFGRKCRAQTLRDLHVHFGIIEQNSILPLDKQLNKHELDNVFDPMARVVERLLCVPSVADKLFRELPFSFEGMREGNLHFGSVDLSNSNLPDGLITIQSRLKVLYDQMYSCFFSDVLLDQKTRENNIQIFFDEMRSNNDDTAKGNIEKLRGFFNWLNLNLKDHPELSDRMFLEGFASTSVFVKKQGEEVWKFLIAPRIISTGNALHALGLVKRVAEPSDEFVAMRSKYVDQLRALGH